MNVERELFLEYTEEIEPRTETFSKLDGEGYEEVRRVVESERARELRQAMETISEL